MTKQDWDRAKWFLIYTLTPISLFMIYLVFVS